MSAGFIAICGFTPVTEVTDIESNFDDIQR